MRFWVFGERFENLERRNSGKQRTSIIEGMVQAYAILASIHVIVYLAETFFSLRKYTNNLDFSGEAFRNGKVYVGVTSVRFRNRNPTTSILNFDLHAPQTFLHNSNEHVLEQVMSLLIAGEAVEQRLGSGYLFAFAYILCGFVGCVASWQIFGMYPPPHLRKSVSDRTIRAIVDGCPSRGGSASTYGLTFMACLLAPDDPVRIPLVLIVFQEFLPKSKRDLKVWKGKPVRQMIAILGASVMMLWNFYFQQNLVSDAVLLRHACIAYLYHVRPSSSHALCDWQSHIAGMVCGLFIVCLAVCFFLFESPLISRSWWQENTRNTTTNIFAMLLNSYCAYLH